MRFKVAVDVTLGNSAFVLATDESNLNREQIIKELEKFFQDIKQRIYSEADA